MNGLKVAPPNNFFSPKKKKNQYTNGISFKVINFNYVSININPLKQLANGATNASIVYHVFFRSFNDIYHSDRVPIKRYHWWKFISSPRHNLSEHADENLWLNADDNVFVNTSDNLDGKNKVSAINNETKKKFHIEKTFD